MDGPLKELAKLEKLSAGTSGKGKSSISDSLDSLLQSLREARDAIQPGAVSPDVLLQLSQAVDLRKKDVDDRQKEIYSSISRLGKALDKKFTAALPSHPDVFTSSSSVTALERTIALHFLRTGQFDTAGIFLQEAGLDIPAELRAQFIDLHRILQALRNQDIGPALGWVAKNRSFLRDRGSPLEFHLHRSQYIRLLLSTHPPNPMLAIAYARETMAPFYAENEDEFKRLTTCIAYLPLSKLQTSPYADLASPSLHFDLEPLFAKDYCASLGMSRQVPLRVVGDIGGGGALARIEKGRKVMRERKSEWSQADELPVDLLDAIIARAGFSATTFPAIFTAYNAVLKERGLDPSEVVYYGKLLKLGTLKGSNWGEKWRMVKLQQGYGDTPQPSRLPTRGPPKPTKNAPTRLTRLDLPPRPPRRTDSLTLHSHEDESTNVDSDDETRAGVNVPQYHLPTQPVAMRPVSPVNSELTSASFGNRKYPPLPPSSRSRPMPPPKFQMWETDGSDATGQPDAPSTPPSYRAVVHESAPAKRQFVIHAAQSPTKRPSSSSLATARQLVAQARERKGSVVNEDDAWNKIKMLQDEKLADTFRQDRLLERYWEVWKENFECIITNYQKFAEARDIFILQLCIHRWRSRTIASRELLNRVATVENSQHLRTALRVWREKTKEREQTRWRASMRSKMKLIRDRRELKLMKDALAKWKQSHKAHSADQHYTRSLVLRHYDHWRNRLAHLDRLDDAADRLSRVIEAGILEKCWHLWKRASQLQLAHKIVTENIGLRVKTEVMDVWRRQMRDNHKADAYYDTVLKKSVLRSWKSARDRLRNMENRAATHAVLQDRLSVRVMYMILKARYQRRRLETIANSSRLKEAWVVWKTRLRQHRKLEDAAVVFSLRLKSPLAHASLENWYKVYSNRKNSETVATFHHSDGLRRRTLLTWRIKLRAQHKLMSKARVVDKFLVVRSAWVLLRAKFAERRREYSLKALELQKTRHVFYAWFERAHRRRVQRLTEEQIRAKIIKRILVTALTTWTNRTIDVKNRELQATIDRDARLIKIAFRKWKSAQGHHAFVVSLMESYQFVKREEQLGKFFHRWLSAARTARHRRLTLDRNETKIRAGVVSAAWDKWRDRFKQQRLQPVEYDIILKAHKTTLIRAFKLWHSKTKSLPAIRFNALRIKRIQARCWNIWLQALPRALQTKTAREMEKKAVLSKFFDKWLQAHRTKIALKAVARARYLRLPPAPIRPTPNSRPAPAPATIISRSMFPRRTVRTEEQTSDDDEAGPSRRRRQAGPRSLHSETSPPRRSQSRFSIPATRASSPARSTFGMLLSREATVFPTRPASSTAAGEGPSSLFRELRQLQRRPKSLSEHSRTREPP
ncbi:hypothetical protein B0H19DRAFT_1221514 [Mycena capillaripes]|nr:hypothetical protein B0H19DRAFT_1221514 [Mycena capillaripes]